MATDAHAPADAHAPEPVGLVLHNPRRYDLRLWLMARGREGAFRRSLVALAGIGAGESVLDIGCGTGSLAIEASRVVGPQGSVVGIDPSPEMIGRANSKARRLKNVSFQTGIAQDLPFGDGSFDVALGTFVVHQLPSDSLHKVKTEVARVLKVGGRLLLVDIGGDHHGRRTPHVVAAAKHGVPLFDLRAIGPTMAGSGLVERASGEVPFRLSFFERVQYLLLERV
jgi:ubiquinone/menaquinone biosynthesis C-methylase UbiE